MLRGTRYFAVILLLIAAMLVTTCAPPPYPTEESPLTTGCDITILALDAPPKMVQDYPDDLSVRGTVAGEECGLVELFVTAGDETIISDIFEVGATGSFYAHAQFMPVGEVSARAITNGGHEELRVQRIEVVEDSSVPRADLFIETVETNTVEQRYAVLMSLQLRTDEPLKGMAICMAPCVEEGHLSLRASSSEIFLREGGKGTAVLLPACNHPTFITCRAINDDVDLPAWATLASATATTLVGGLEPADLGGGEQEAALVWAESIAPLYPFATVATYLKLARGFDLSEHVIQVDMTDAQSPETAQDPSTLPFLRIMAGRGWRDLEWTRNVGFFFIPGVGPGIAPPEDIPPVPLDPGEDVLPPPDEREGRDIVKELGLEDIDGLADPLKVKGLRSAIDEMTDPKRSAEDSDSGPPALSSPFGYGGLPRDPSSMTPDERFRSVLGSAWTNFVRSLDTPPGGHRGPVSSSDPTYSGGVLGKIWDGLTVLAEGVSTAGRAAAAGAVAAVGTVVTVADMLWTATSGAGSVWNCDGLGGTNAANCRRITDAAANQYDPSNTQDDTPGNFCAGAMKGQGTEAEQDCIKKTQKKWNNFCQENPNHPNCGKFCDKYPNDPSCKKKHTPTPKPPPTDTPKPPSSKKSAGRCDPNVNPDCDDQLDPRPEDFLKGEKHVLNINLRVCSSTEVKVMPGQQCETQNRARIALAAKQVEAAVCKKWAEIDAKCERRQVTVMRAKVKHVPDPVGPDPSD